MAAQNFRDLPPNVGESTRDYCLRLQDLGHEETFIGKALRYHLRVGLSELGAYLNELELARLRHLTMLRRMEPNRTHYSMVKKVARNLSISDELAELWVARFEEVGDVHYVGIKTPRPERT